MKRERRPTKKPAHIFSGFVACHCGAKMYVPMRTPKYTCQKCRNSIGCQDLEEIFTEEVKGYLVKPDNIKSYLNRAGNALNEKQALHIQRQKEAEKLKLDTERMLRLYLDGNIGAEDFKKFNEPLSDQRSQLDEEIVRLLAEVDVLKIDNLSSEQLVTEALYLDTRWPEMSLGEKRRVAESMVRSIIVGDGEIEFNLVQLPSYQEITNWQNTYHHVNRAARRNRGNAGSVRRLSDARHR
jgi:site-specific DNA recombinase